MSTTTTNYGFVKPAGSDRIDVALLDYNFDAIDTELLRADSSVFNVKSYGAVGNGVHDDTTAIQTALDAMSSGDALLFPTGTYLISAALAPGDGVTLVPAPGCVISQATQYKPVFDLFNVDDVTVSSGFTLVNASGPPSGQGSSFRGDAGYAYSTGVWTNGNRITIGDLRIEDFAMGVYVNSSNGVLNGDGVLRTGNRVGNLEVSGCNHGVLYCGQSGLRIGNIYAYDFVDSSSGGNPMHAVYGTGAITLPSENIHVGDCLAVNNPTGQGFQFKYVDGLTVGRLTARNTYGLLNVISCTDATFASMTSTDDVGLQSVTIQKGSTLPARFTFDTITLALAADLNASSVQLISNDVYIAQLSVTAARNNGSYTSQMEVLLCGERITIDSIKLRNTGSAPRRAIRVGAVTYPSGDATLRNIEIDGYLSLVDIDSTADGTNVIDYAPASQRRIPYRGSNYIAASGGTPLYSIVRRPHTNVYTVASGSTSIYPLPALETLTYLNVTDASAFTIQVPTIGQYVGLTHEIAIHNGTGSGLGTITWSSYYTLTGTLTAPAAGVTILLRFIWDGSHWREISRTA